MFRRGIPDVAHVASDYPILVLYVRYDTILDDYDNMGTDLHVYMYL